MIIRTERKNNFSVINNYLINDDNLDWKDIGLLIYLLSKPNNWKIKAEALAEQKKTGIRGVYSILANLENGGYIKKKRNNDGTVNWYIYDEPQTDKVVSEMPNKKSDPYLHNVDEGPDMLDCPQPIDLPPHVQNVDKAQVIDLPPHLHNVDDIVSTDIVNTDNSSSSYLATKDFPPTEKTDEPENDIPNRIGKYQELFVNEFGYDLHETRHERTICMFQDWVQQRYPVSRIKLAIENTMKKNNLRPGVIHYFRKPVQQFMEAFRVKKIAQEKPNLPSYEDYKKAKQEKPADPETAKAALMACLSKLKGSKSARAST